MDEDQLDDQPVDELEEGTEEEEIEEADDADEEQQEPTDELAESSESEVEDDQPASVFLPTGEGPATARLREMLDPDVNAAVQAAIQEQVTRAMQSFGVSQAAYAAAAAQHPEVFRKYGSKIQMALSMMPEQDRHTRKAVDYATTLAVLDDKAGTPEFGRAMLRLAQQLTGDASAPKPPKAPIPSASRPPSPSSGVRAQTMPPREARIKDVMKLGVDREEAEEMQYALNKKPTRR